jgi:hypothetical protein
MLYHPSSVTGRAFSRRTVNGRLRRLAIFYHWAFRQGLVARLPFEYDSVRAPIGADAQLLAHLGTDDTVAALDLTVREYRTIPTALSVEDLRRVRSHLGPRDALIADWADSTGARRAEVLSLSVSDIPDSHALGTRRSFPFRSPARAGGGGHSRSPWRSLIALISTSRSAEAQLYAATASIQMRPARYGLASQANPRPKRH